MKFIRSPTYRVIHRSLIFDVIRGIAKKFSLKHILEAITAQKQTPNPWPFKEKPKPDLETVAEIETSLAALEEAHIQHRAKLLSANSKINNPDVTKVCEMVEEISSLRERFRAEENAELVLDQPNPSGRTPLHVSSLLNNGHATQLLLEHGANPNVQDAEGNTPLHTVCEKKDIKSATAILRVNGRLLKNKEKGTPLLVDLFLDTDEDEVEEMMEAIDQSKHKREILDEVLKKGQLLIRLVEEEKPEILSIVLQRLTKSDQEEYIDLVQDDMNGNTALYIATMIKKNLKCTSLLLEAGAKLKSNANGLLPKIEDFFTEENDDQITSALVDGLVKRVETKQLEQEKALELLLGDRRKQMHFPKASVMNWGLIAQWKDEDDERFDFNKVVSKMSESDLLKMVKVAREGHLEKKLVTNLLCAEDEDGKVFLSRLDFNIQTEVAMWDQERINEVVHKISSRLCEWITDQANSGKWTKQKLALAVCKRVSESQNAQKVNECLLEWVVEQADEDVSVKEELANAVSKISPDKIPTLCLLSGEIQKKLAALDKGKTCEIVPWLDGDLQEWIYKEGMNGSWDQEMVSKVLEKEVDGALSAKAKMIGREKSIYLFTIHVQMLYAELELSSMEVNSNHPMEAFGRFDLVPGEEREGSPVYRQAHSTEMPTAKEILLHR